MCQSNIPSQNTDSYPINALRNLAMKRVYTDYMLLVDGDFMMSPHFEESFQLAISQMFSLPTDRVAYVVPVFELVAEKWNQEQVNTATSSLLYIQKQFSKIIMHCSYFMQSLCVWHSKCCIVCNT